MQSGTVKVDTTCIGTKLLKLGNIYDILPFSMLLTSYDTCWVVSYGLIMVCIINSVNIGEGITNCAEVAL